MLDIHAVGCLLGGDDKPVHKATILRWIEAGTFPPGIRISTNTVRWRQEDVQAWLDGRPRGCTRMSEERKAKIRAGQAKAKAQRRARRASP